MDKEVRIAIVGKYTHLCDSYISVSKVCIIHIIIHIIIINQSIKDLSLVCKACCLCDQQAAHH